MTAEQIWGVIRTILAAIGGWAVGKGYIDNEILTAILGGLGTIFIAGWSWWSKKAKTV
jgi:hypothetical protein